MPNPQGAANAVGHTLRFSELGISGVAGVTVNGTASADIAGSTTVNFTAYKTVVPETVIVLCQLASGSGTLNVQATTAGTYASADSSTPVNTTSLTGTAGQFAVLSTSSTNRYINAQLVSAGGGCRLSRILVLPLAVLTGSEDWFNVRDGVMAVASGVGPGTDVYNNPAAQEARVDPTSDGSGTFVFDLTV